MQMSLSVTQRNSKFEVFIYLKFEISKYIYIFEILKFKFQISNFKFQISVEILNFRSLLQMSEWATCCISRIRMHLVLHTEGDDVLHTTIQCSTLQHTTPRVAFRASRSTLYCTQTL